VAKLKPSIFCQVTAQAASKRKFWKPIAVYEKPTLVVGVERVPYRGMPALGAKSVARRPSTARKGLERIVQNPLVLALGCSVISQHQLVD
jgi:hypothetical protein